MWLVEAAAKQGAGNRAHARAAAATPPQREGRWRLPRAAMHSIGGNWEEWRLPTPTSLVRKKPCEPQYCVRVYACVCACVCAFVCVRACVFDLNSGKQRVAEGASRQHSSVWGARGTRERPMGNIAWFAAVWSARARARGRRGQRTRGACDAGAQPGACRQAGAAGQRGSHTYLIRRGYEGGLCAFRISRWCEHLAGRASHFVGGRVTREQGRAAQGVGLGGQTGPPSGVEPLSRPGVGPTTDAAHRGGSSTRRRSERCAQSSLGLLSERGGQSAEHRESFDVCLNCNTAQDTKTVHIYI